VVVVKELTHLTSRGGRPSLRGKEPEAVSRTGFAKREENTIHDGERGDVLRELGVESGHEEAAGGKTKSALSRITAWQGKGY
jgi:hypothetical protein